MARCECEKCIHNKVCVRYEYLSRDLILVCENYKSTEDVVPRAEYDELKEQFDILDAECDRMEKAESKHFDEVEQAKQEIAREIFAEIDIALCEYEMGDTAFADFYNNIKELKKKYIGE